MRHTVDANEMPFAFPEGTITRATEKAVLFEVGPDKYWIPKSVIHDDSDIWKEGQSGVLKVKAWWATKNGHA